MYPSEYDYKTAVLRYNIENTNIFNQIQKLCPNYSQQEVAFITSYFSLALTVALSDDKIYKSEFNYICSTLPTNIKLTESQKEQLVLISLSDMFSERNYSSSTPYFCQFITENFSPKQREDFIQLLLTLALVDSDFHSLEKSVIKCYLQRLEIAPMIFEKVKPKAKKIAENFTRSCDDQHYSFIRNLSRNSIKIKVLIQNKIDYRLQENLRSKLSPTPLFQLVQKRMDEMSFPSQAFISSFFSYAFAMLFIDGEVHKKELAYIRHIANLNFACSENTLDSLIDLGLFLGERNQYPSEHLKIFAEVMKITTHTKCKPSLMAFFTNLARADDSIHPMENILLSQLFETFNVKNKFKAIISQAQGIDGSIEIIPASKWQQKV